MFEVMFFSFTSQTNKKTFRFPNSLRSRGSRTRPRGRGARRDPGRSALQRRRRRARRPPSSREVATSAMTFGIAARPRSRSKRAAQSATTRVAAISSFASAICSLPTVAPGRSSNGFSMFGSLKPPKQRRVPRRCRGVAVGVGVSAAAQAASAATRIESMVSNLVYPTSTQVMTRLPGPAGVQMALAGSGWSRLWLSGSGGSCCCAYMNLAN